MNTPTTLPPEAPGKCSPAFVFYRTQTGHVMRAKVLTRHRDRSVTVEPFFWQTPDFTDEPAGCFQGGHTVRVPASHLVDDPAAAVALTPAIRKMLLVLASTDSGIESYEKLRKAAGITRRQAGVVRQRMMINGFAEIAPYNGSPRIKITEAGRDVIEAMLDTLIMLTDCNLSAPARAAVDAAIAKVRGQ